MGIKLNNDICRFIFQTSLCFLLFSQQLFAITFEEARLVKKDFQLYQAWSLARNYLFGTTLKSDRVQALAWEKVYLDLLPAAYPKKTDLLARFQAGLNPEQMQQADNLARQFVEQYNLGSTPLTEAELSKAYVLRDEPIAWKTVTEPIAPRAVAGNFHKWMQWLDEQGLRATVLDLDQRAYQLFQDKAYPIVYGQVIVRGIESPEMVSSEVSILPGGYFVAQAKGGTISFSLPGYKTIVIPIAPEQQVQSFYPIVLDSLPQSPRTGVIGRVLPWEGADKSNIILRSVADNEHMDSSQAWKYPALPLTVTNHGEFYTTGLSQGHYQLIINTAGVSSVIKFFVKEQEVRGLSLIDLRKQAAAKSQG
ncbi:hypothetical protein Lbir_0551 [Legionella birminghamensis]|uniref:Uncharacterized protein n=1 Tax=Legionella birminghamensis TaxID=28083 RepID=A0A378IAQ2_9GAMM|nr:hypothetical protein [Legionella birminghamensis]KTC75177.1 hypothetical protein Lbir_0551 [Legionella birminghamensis]STX31872.1 Uncharacterised protein [Legionella birminghamensis]